MFERLKKLLAAPARHDTSVLGIVVRCHRCGEVVRGQIDLHNELSVEYEGEAMRYFCRKGLMGTGQNRCFQTIVVEYTFDANRNVTDRRIEGGAFMDERAQGA